MCCELCNNGLETSGHIFGVLKMRCYMLLYMSFWTFYGFVFRIARAKDWVWSKITRYDSRELVAINDFYSNLEAIYISKQEGDYFSYYNEEQKMSCERG